ncbi:YadA-like family protein [Paraburkholderia sp. JPY419]|uniref:YadA-like family protein n=2 Tax=unclassified Paraburkholderia TaxID=2615204 RepID=UPI003D1D7398
MNKSYISVWNEALGSWVAACENSKTRGKRGKSKAVSLMGAALLATSAIAPLAHAQYAAGSGLAEGPSSVAIGADSGNAAFALGDSSTAVGSNAAATGAGSAAFGNDTTAIGTGSFAAGGGSHDGSTPGAIAAADWSVALGRSTVMYGATAGIAIGLNNTASAAGAVVMGSNSIASGSDSIAFGTGTSATAANSVALGSGSIADRENTVSVGSAMAMRQITNVAAGTQDSDAVVVSQLKGVTSALGGGAAVDADGSVKAPAYSVGGTTVDNVGDAFANVDARTTQNTANVQNIAGDVMNITNGLDNGTIGLVQQDATSRDITVAKDADGSAINVAGTAGNRTVTGVAAGAVRASSVDAVNGGQLYGTASSTARALGGGSIVLADGSISAPKFSVGGTTAYSVAEAVTNLDGRTTQNAGDIALNAGDIALNATDIAKNTSNIAQNASSITNVQNQLSEGTVGLVQQDATSRDISVAKDADGSVINVAGTAGNRTVTGVAAGAVRATSVDAVNGGQLYGTASSTARALGGGSIVLADGSISAPKFSVGGTTVYSVAEAVTNLDGRTTQNTGDIALNAGEIALNATDIAKNTSNIAQNASSITSVQNQLSEGTIGLVQQDATSRDITVAKDADGSAINVAGTAGNRTVTGVAAGAVRVSSVDAVNGGQLYGTASSTARALGGGSIVLADGSISAPKFSVGGTTVYSVAEAVTNLDGRTTQNTGDIALNATDIAKNASNIEQNASSIMSVQNQLSEGTVGLVQQDATSRDITVAKDADGSVINVAGTAGNRTVTGVAAGAVRASSVDAVNGGQLYGTASSTARALGGGSIVLADGSISAPKFSVGGTTVYSVAEAVTNLDGRTMQNTGDIAQNAGDIALNATDIAKNTSNIAQNASSITNVQNQLSEGTVGLVQQDATSRDITVAKDADGSVINVAGTAGNRTVTGVAAGAVRVSSVDAVNGGQLYGTASSTARALGGGSIVLADGSISAPKFSVGGTTVYSVAEAVTNLDGRTTQNTGDIAQNATNIASVQNQLSEGTVGLVQQDANTRDITVAKDMDGTVVNVAGAAGNRTVTGVANGAVNASSVDAINGGQLYGAASSTAEALGGGSTVNADGTLSAPSYSVGGTTVHSVGDAVTNLDGRTTQNTEDITKLQTQVGDVGTQLSAAVQYDRRADGSVNLGAVTLGGGQSTGPVILTNVANGTSQYDAVNYGQLSALQNQVTDLNGQVWNLGSQMSNLQPGNSVSEAEDASSSGAGNDVVVNVATPGTGAGSTTAGAGAAASGNYATVIGASANAAADNAVAVGANAAATGASSTAIGTGSQAANANSVALGQGSVTDRDNSVSVGSATQQRQITNVAAGTADTDAVNVGQMNSSVAQGVQQANNYTDMRFNDLNSTIDSIAKKSYSGSAAAIATANLPQAPAAGKSIVAVAGGTYAGQSAVAVGLSTFTRNGKWIIKASGSTTTAGSFAVGAGAGFVF